MKTFQREIIENEMKWHEMNLTMFMLNFLCFEYDLDYF